MERTSKSDKSNVFYGILTKWKKDNLRAIGTTHPIKRGPTTKLQKGLCRFNRVVRPLTDIIINYY